MTYILRALKRVFGGSVIMRPLLSSRCQFAATISRSVGLKSTMRGRLAEVDVLSTEQRMTI